MPPRRYDMGARADAVAETKARIVKAAMELHAKHGVQATRWEEIAARAEISTATMYRHFPSLKELVPSCARTVFDLIQPLTLQQAEAKFKSIEDSVERLAFLVRANVHCYARGEAWLHAAYRERDFIPELNTALGIIQMTLRVLIEASGSRRRARKEEAALFALLDFPFYKALRDQDLEPRDIERTITKLAQEIEEENRRK